MAKYRKKPIVIEAFQMTPERREDNSEWPEWLHRAWNLDATEPGSCYSIGSNNKLAIHTLEGVLLVLWDDYIIQGVQGELYPCKPDIFEATYDLVEE